MPALFDPAHSPQVKAWLTKELGPICDAEPDVLADYVIALLKHDASEGELKSLLDEQLADFLDDKTGPFVSKLVSALSKKSYLPKVAAAAPSGPSSSRKRPAEDDEEHSRQQPPAAKSARPSAGNESTPAAAAAPRGPASDRRNGTPTGPSSDRESTRERERDISERSSSARPQQPGQQQQQSAAPGIRGKEKDLCRDFHQKGWCSRGEQCRWEHSGDAIMGTSMPPQGQFPGGIGIPQQQQQQQGAPFNQRQAGSPPGPNGFMGRPPMMMNMPPGGMPPGFQMQMGPQGWQGGPPQQHQQGQMPMGFPPGSNGPEGLPLGMRLGEQQPQNSPPPFAGHDGVQPAPQRGGFAGRGRGGGQAVRPGTFQSRARSATTLVIENVPAESLDLVKINDYFKRFGTITNIQVDAPGSKALVSYSSPQEAKAAHESPEVIFGNRFVKVYFQKLDDSNGGGPAQPRPPPPQKQTFAAGQNVYRPPGAAGAAASTSGTSSPSHAAGSSSSTPYLPGGLTPEQHAARRSALEAQKAAQLRFNELMTEQKQLLVKATSSATSAEEKKAAMKRLKEVEPGIKEAGEKVREAFEAIKALPQPTKAAPPGAKAEQREKMERERLDRELEAHASQPDTTTGGGDSAEGSSNGASGSSSANPALVAKLAALQAEATSMGLDKTGAPISGSSRGGYTARGRGAYRGARGGGAAAPMRLDNRSTKLYVLGPPAGEEQKRTKVKEWLSSFGEVSEFDEAPSEENNGEKVGLAVTFKHRSMGEQAVRTLIAASSGTGSKLPAEVDGIKLVWAPAPQRPASIPTTPAGGEGIEGSAAKEEGDHDGEENWKR
ncbi:hypothetical protein BDZ90DRAFT_275423 [Jaminaea rosea]|uniref:C3H1-type domain-containing protein n=1 Tax=Jaminaea rosea TaxID=1569628 RepID=A0A316UNB2_9BASI|nr:hypothetical protein BDZ90DRAFT_275423 [Jaminaea rosea]PWN26288.1 hypothetical protein BDZ90DRAFT_275423 [Jaminaea rosea]